MPRVPTLGQQERKLTFSNQVSRTFAYKSASSNMTKQWAQWNVLSLQTNFHIIQQDEELSKKQNSLINIWLQIDIG